MSLKCTSQSPLFNAGNMTQIGDVNRLAFASRGKHVTHDLVGIMWIVPTTLLAVLCGRDRLRQRIDQFVFRTFRPTCGRAVDPS